MTANPADAPLLTVEGIEAYYGRVQVLFGVSCEVAPQERVALLGTNGSGKTTLLKVISGLLVPSSGSVWFDGLDITRWSPADRVAAGIVQMPGGNATFPSLSVLENLRIGAYRFLRDKSLVEERLEEALGLFPQIRNRLEQSAGTLSGGEQQMMALARAFIAGPRLLMVDELSLGLAPVVLQSIVGMLEEILRRGVTMILVEQSLNISLSLADRAYFMDRGEIRFGGAAEDLLAQDSLVRAAFFGVAQHEPPATSHSTTKTRRNVR